MTPAGERREVGRYDTTDGVRGIYAQRIAGRVALSDAPIDHDGRVTLIERHVTSTDELEGLVADYLAAKRAAENVPAEGGHLASSPLCRTTTTTRPTGR